MKWNHWGWFTCIISLNNTIAAASLNLLTDSFSTRLSQWTCLSEAGFHFHSATKMVREVMSMEYEDRLKELKLPKLQKRRVRDDMILTYRLLIGDEGIHHERFFSLEQSRYHLRGDQHLNIRRFFFHGEWLINRTVSLNMMCQLLAKEHSRKDMMSKRLSENEYSYF